MKWEGFQLNSTSSHVIECSHHHGGLVATFTHHYDLGLEITVVMFRFLTVIS